MRRTELEKIDTLEDKIKLELSQLSERQEAMEKEVAEFGSVSVGGGGQALAVHVSGRCSRPSGLRL